MKDIRKMGDFISSRFFAILTQISALTYFAVILFLLTSLLSGSKDLMAAPKLLPIMRISVENTASHFQTRAVERFAQQLKTALDKRIDVQFFSNARLFRDADVIRALGQGKIEMAVPGTWHVTRYVPDVGVFQLPVFYGRSAQDIYSILDSPLGKNLNARIEKTLNFKVIGGWIDLGYAHLFGIRQQIRQHEDIEGLKVRVAGGLANKLRIQGLGGDPMIIPWPDLPDHIYRGRVDAVLTTYETIKSAQMWDMGVTSVFEDRQYFPQYVPLIRNSFWKRLPEDIQQIIMDLWENNIDDSRNLAADSQHQAKDRLLEEKVMVSKPLPKQMDAWRNRLIPLQDGFVKQLGIDPDLVRQVTRELERQ
ncbi:extracellular solute-binding protein, family 7 [Desulfotignum phosphitoxidans DSM 13687]|uniref:Extracellular solute-binding protein, family 7 n=2 Tax=Desulfobacteraceae TaxID=213119 RepID=S0FRK2_9BACT|nr:extracellular solute-binding protein, family 7 [Desulfotignum phosphitoxidans DSM 13687]